ncbi:hypothetical protein EV356DRAFT_529873 [Viridothelium virens]|uniref:HCNGP-domain-containing protein n=1 Tax=Viridothelium virens TaxID=1048519 RepID=A0A6A6HHD6_VIRVR|nr:hypothetical protein EV356DRAFT_529873 [Viridothelium virens]
MSAALGLVDYGSSDEEGQIAPRPDREDRDIPHEPDLQPRGSTKEAPQSTDVRGTSIPQRENPSKIPTKPSIESKRQPEDAAPATAVEDTTIQGSSASSHLPASEHSPLPGPSLGPARPPGAETADESISHPQSPYSIIRSQLRSVTMPPVPNFSVPPSPPGSPPAQVTKKFEQFLELKQKGRHFNETLANSSALRNPTLLQKLIGFAGISEEDQYATTLPAEAAIPTKFPEWAYGDQLDKAQKAIAKKREEEASKKQRESLNFVKASGSGTSSRSTTPGTAPRAGHSAAERILAELDGKGPQSQLRATDRKSGRSSGSRSRFDQRSRSPAQ